MASEKFSYIVNNGYSKQKYISIYLPISYLLPNGISKLHLAKYYLIEKLHFCKICDTLYPMRSIYNISRAYIIEVLNIFYSFVPINADDNKQYNTIKYALDTIKYVSARANKDK